MTASSFYDTALGEWMGEPKVPRIEYIVARPRAIDPNALTEQELAWIRDAQENDE
jgi:hypothetical protein